MNTFIIVATIITGIVALVMVGLMGYYHWKCERNKVAKISSCLLIPFLIFVVIFVIALSYNRSYIDTFDNGIYAIDVSKLEKAMAEDKYGYLDTLYDAAIKSGSDEIKLQNKTDEIRIIFPTETYDYEATIGVNGLKLLDEQNIISLIKAEE